MMANARDVYRMPRGRRGEAGDVVGWEGQRQGGWLIVPSDKGQARPERNGQWVWQFRGGVVDTSFSLHSCSLHSASGLLCYFEQWVPLLEMTTHVFINTSNAEWKCSIFLELPSTPIQHSWQLHLTSHGFLDHERTPDSHWTNRSLCLLRIQLDCAEQRSYKILYS